MERRMAGALGRDTSSADRVAVHLRELIVTGQLTPGQHIRQERMADELGVSRAPLREALKQLSSEGLVTHLHNSGYAVAQLRQDQFDQIYLMRRLLEKEVILQLPRPAKKLVASLTRLNEQITELSTRLDISGMQLLNHKLHFTMFRQSGLELFVTELERLWRWAMPYHTVYLYDSSGRERLIREHTEMIEAYASGDNAEVARIMDLHRVGGEQHMNMRFNTPPASLLAAR
jgi:DNA-binding GntR family transcriptional regulator